MSTGAPFTSHKLFKSPEYTVITPSYDYSLKFYILNSTHIEEEKILHTPRSSRWKLILPAALWAGEVKRELSILS